MLSLARNVVINNGRLPDSDFLVYLALNDRKLSVMRSFTYDSDST